MKTLNRFFLPSIFLLTLIISACASRPKLYPNEALKTKGKVASEADIDQCIKDADTYLESSEGKKLAKGAGFGAVLGGTIGAVGGLFTGNIARGAAEGAAMGGAGGAVGASLTPDQLKHQYVNQCLSDKGYHVIGWD